MIATPLALLREVRSDDTIEALRMAALDAEIERGVAERTAALEATVAELERRGYTKANKSQLIRIALSQLDIDKLPPPSP